MLEVEFVFFEFGYFLVCKFFVKLFLICWSSFGLVKILMVVIVRVFFWDKVKGWVVGLFVKRCYDWLKRIMKWLDFKEFFIMIMKMYKLKSYFICFVLLFLMYWVVYDLLKFYYVLFYMINEKRVCDFRS